MTKIRVILFLFLTFSILGCIESKRTRIKIECDNINNNDFSEVGYIASCVFRSVNVEKRFATISAPVKHNVQAVQFVSSSLEYFPGGLAAFFPNLKAVVMQEVGLTQISKYDLKEFGEKLMHLDFYNNKFDWLERDLFKFNPSLKYVRMEYTNLKYIDSGFFDEVAKIKTLNSFDLGNCGCISRSFYKSNYRSDHDFETEMESNSWETNDCLKSRKEKIISPNSPNRKSDMNLVSAINLIRLFSSGSDNMDSNINITCDCNEDISISCTCETKIDRENIALKNLVLNSSSDDFDIMTVSELEFVRTSLFMYFPTEFNDARLKHLNSLTVRSCGLVKIEKRNFDHIKTIKQLDLSDNLLMTIPPKVFDDLEQLEELSLSSNELELIDVNVFEKLKSLKFLELDKNKLKIISAGLFETLSDEIEYVILEENSCIDMTYPYEEKATLTDHILDNCMESVMLNCIISDESTCQATELNITYPKMKILMNEKTENPVNAKGIHHLKIEDQEMKFIPFNLSAQFPHLERMSVNNSMLSKLFSFDFNGLSSLKTLEITNNNITKIADNTFDDLRSLETLDLSANEITSLPTGIFVPLINLRTLNLSQNKLTVFKTNFLLVKNVIEIFDISNNEITEFESRTLKHLRKAKVIDLTENSCIDVRYERSTDKSDALMNLFGKVEFNCNI